MDIIAAAPNTEIHRDPDVVKDLFADCIFRETFEQILWISSGLVAWDLASRMNGLRCLDLKGSFSMSVLSEVMLILTFSSCSLVVWNVPLQ